MKKRLLSLILAITVIASLLPTMALSASAADVSYTYSFNPNGLASSNALNQYKYSDTNDTWEFVAAKSLNTGAIYPQTYNRSNFSGMFIRWSGSAAPWAAFRIKVPKAGTYKATLGYGERHVGATINVYVLPASVTSLSGNESSFDNGIKLNDDPVITLNADQTGNVTAVKSVPLDNTFTTTVDNEERIIVFDADAANKNQYLYIANLVIEQIAVYTVTYDANGASEAPAATVSPAGDITLPEAPVREGYSFIGWSDGTNTYDAGATYTVSGNITLTAKWQKTGPNMFIYDFSLAPCETSADIGSVGYGSTNGMWSTYINSREALSILKINAGIRIRSSAGYWASFKINVPASGKYNVFLNHIINKGTSTTKAGFGDIYLLDADTKDIAAALETATPINAEEIAYVSTEITSTQTPKTKLCEDYTFEKGEYIIVFYSTRKHPDCHNEAGMYPMSLVLEGDAAAESYAGKVSLAKSELTAGESTTAETVIFNTETGSAVTGNVTYRSSDENVAKVEGNSVKAVGVGKAEIIATYSGKPENGNIVSAPITVSDSTDDSVIFGKATNVDAKIEIDGTLRRGDTVILNAEDIEGYEFIGWKRGNAITGKFIVGAPQKNFEYKVYSNAFITAIYEEKEPAGATGVELWNQSGELIAKYTAAEFNALSKLPTPTLIGYEFVGYKTGNSEVFEAGETLSNGITRAVAEFEPLTVAGPFVCDDVTSELTKNSMPFNSAITAETTSTTFSCWIRNNMIVSYDKEYTYYIWGAADISNSKIDVPEDKKPIVILEEGYGAYLLEYDAADYEIVEAGIVAANGKATVGSSSEKYIAQKCGKHGQFAVKLGAEYSDVRGYVVYRDGAAYKIAYSD